MAHVKFNRVDTFADRLADKIEAENKNHHWQFKALFTGSGNRLVKAMNEVREEAMLIAKKYNVTLQDGCVSPISGGWKFDRQGNIIGEQTDRILLNYIFHGENCYEAAEALDNFYEQIIK